MSYEESKFSRSLFRELDGILLCENREEKRLVRFVLMVRVKNEIIKKILNNVIYWWRGVSGNEDIE